MHNFDLSMFLNTFFYKVSSNKYWANKKIQIHLQFLYGLGGYSSEQLCVSFGINRFIKSSKLNILEWELIYDYLYLNFNLLLFDLKVKNVKRIRVTKTYRGWRHIFNLPTRGQRSHTNARTRKKYRIT